MKYGFIYLEGKVEESLEELIMLKYKNWIFDIVIFF